MGKIGVLTFFLLIISGCAVVKSYSTDGKKYDVKNTISIQPGMSQEEVLRLLGEPYAIGRKSNGDTFFYYKWLDMSGTEVGIGFFIMGIKKTITPSGGQAEVIFDPEKKLKSISYSIIGKDYYDGLRRGMNVKGN